MGLPWLPAGWPFIESLSLPKRWGLWHQTANLPHWQHTDHFLLLVLWILKKEVVFLSQRAIR